MPQYGIHRYTSEESNNLQIGQNGFKELTGAGNTGDGTFCAFYVTGKGTTVDVDRKNALRFVNCLQPAGSKLKFRDEEDQFSRQYFCRLPAGGFNFSNSPTFVSGSNNELRQKSMWDNPTTFVSQVQLYNPAGDVVAVGNLSSAIKKNKTSEATIKVKLTY